MPRRTDIKTILVIGSGPIVIGQACEFDYSGTQACKVLRAEGYRVILLNSNPATIMTDQETADEVYIEPIDVPTVRKILSLEQVDALLPTVGGQTSLNTALALQETGVLDEYGVKLIGADENAIRTAENRECFETAMHELGYQTTPARHVRNLNDAHEALASLGLPLVIRPSFTMGGSGGATVVTEADYISCVENALHLSRIHEVVVEKSIVGWKEFELEVMKDNVGNAVIVCSIENLDPIGIHTGDSITVAPQQTLSDRQYQTLRNMSIQIINKIGVDTGGANVQFAVNPDTDEVLVIEMNPRVSRSSALASKATGFPIAKIAAKLAVGYTLDEIENDITRSTPACFEPSIDYVVVKIPRFAFEKFTTASPYLGIQMKSVGETMALGRSFQEAFQKAIRALELTAPGFDGHYFAYHKLHALSPAELKARIAAKQGERHELKNELKKLHYNRIAYIKDLFYLGATPAEVSQASMIDPWFIHQLAELFNIEQTYWKQDLTHLLSAEAVTAIPSTFAPQDIPTRHSPHFLRTLKACGFSDIQLGYIFNCSESEVRAIREKLQIRPNYKVVDTCAGEFAAETPYYYSSYDDEDELSERLAVKSETAAKRIVILGGGPNRIGQGIEFDYMCVQASLELRKLGYAPVMLNSNPETVSTDYDVSAMLFFEPLTVEDTLAVLHAVKAMGVIVHFGGQTSLNLSADLAAAGIKLLGTQQENIFISEDRKSFRAILDELKALQPESEAVFSYEETLAAARRIGFPVLIRPSFVLGGRAMKVAYNETELKVFFAEARATSLLPVSILVDKYLKAALEVDVDLIADGENAVICGVLEHIEEAGIHSGDSACFLPPQNISPPLLKKITLQAKQLAKQLKIIGLMNIQFAIHQNNVYFLEANPRGSRTIPFVSKATGVPWVKLAVRVMMGAPLSAEQFQHDFKPETLDYVALKEAVLPFNKFPNEDPLLGPEMKSTGEVMGVGETLAEAFYKTQAAIHQPLPIVQRAVRHAVPPTTATAASSQAAFPYVNVHASCGILISLSEKPREIIPYCRILCELGYTLYATPGTAAFLKKHDLPSRIVQKLDKQTKQPGDNELVAKIIDGTIKLVFNTPAGRQAEISDAYIRLVAQRYGIGVFTTLKAMYCATEAIKVYTKNPNFKAYSIHSLANKRRKNSLTSA